jgi:signal transduction histidine kinase
LVDLTRPLTPQPTELDLVSLARRIALEADVDVAIEAPDVAAVRSDATMIAEVLRNLLLNAAQAGADRVVVQVQASDEGWWLDVCDNGPGVEDVKPIFSWFHTTRAAGSGLGLPVSRRIAVALGGNLTLVAAQPATFRLELVPCQA